MVTGVPPASWVVPLARSPVVASAADRMAGPAEQEQDHTDDGQDGADGLQDGDLGDEADDEQDDA